MVESICVPGFRQVRDTLKDRLGEPAPGRIQVLTGPRQVGKTTLLLQLAEDLGPRSLYIACDGPETGLPGFWDRLWQHAEEIWSEHGLAVVLLDEVQHLADWATKLKAEWDRIRRRRLGVHVVATGSSALQLGSGTRQSLAGRFERLTLMHWSASAIAEVFDVPVDDAAAMLVSHGTFPGAVGLLGDPPRWAAYIRDSIVEPAIGRDILAMAQVRRPGLLRQIFAIAACSPAQIISLQKLQGQLQDRGALQTISHYLQLLQEAYLVAPLQKHSTRPLRRRSAPPKLVPLSNAYCAAIDPLGIPGPDTDPSRFGRWVENACLACAWNAGQQVTYWREEPLEVDGIIEGSWGRFAIEVKTGPFAATDLIGLLEFTRRQPEFRPLVLCDPEQVSAAERLGIDAISWTDFLLRGPSRLT